MNDTEILQILSDARKWPYYPIEMPVRGDGTGPGTVGKDAVSVAYEVWDRHLMSHASFAFLPDAISDAIERSICELRDTE